jgi:hypothetical protein
MRINNPNNQIYESFDGSIILNYKGLNIDLANTIIKRNCTIKINISEHDKVESKFSYLNIYFTDLFNSEIELCLIRQKLVTANIGSEKMQIGFTLIEKVYFDVDHSIISGKYILDNIYTLATYINDTFEFIIAVENNQLGSRDKNFQYFIEKLGLINA